METQQTSLDAKRGTQGAQLSPVKVLRFPDVVDRTGLSRSAIYARLDCKAPEYDSTFPRPVSLGCGGRSVGFVESEIDAWLQSRLLDRRGPGHSHRLAA